MPSATATCGRSEELLDLVYGEAAGEASASLQSHVASCAACRDEVAELRQLRVRLAEWRLPVAGPLPRQPRTAYLRSFAAAAAVLLLVGGAFFWGRSAATETPARVAALLAAADERQRAEIQELRVALTAREPQAGSPQGDAFLRQVREMIAQSEARQQEHYRTTLAAFSTAAERQRRMDLARVSASLSFLDGKNGQQAARTTELMGYLIQASAAGK